MCHIVAHCDQLAAHFLWGDLFLHVRAGTCYISMSFMV
jgi:hypothetical protein